MIATRVHICLLLRVSTYSANKNLSNMSQSKQPKQSIFAKAKDKLKSPGSAKSDAESGAPDLPASASRHPGDKKSGSLSHKFERALERSKDLFNIKSFSQSQGSLVPGGSNAMALAPGAVDSRSASVPPGAGVGLLTGNENLAEPGATGMCFLVYHRARS
jgi:hypothetical protein